MKAKRRLLEVGRGGVCNSPRASTQWFPEIIKFEYIFCCIIVPRRRYLLHFYITRGVVIYLWAKGKISALTAFRCYYYFLRNFFNLTGWKHITVKVIYLISETGSGANLLIPIVIFTPITNNTKGHTSDLTRMRKYCHVLSKHSPSMQGASHWLLWSLVEFDIGF